MLCVHNSIPKTRLLRAAVWIKPLESGTSSSLKSWACRRQVQGQVSCTRVLKLKSNTFWKATRKESTGSASIHLWRFLHLLLMIRLLSFGDFQVTNIGRWTPWRVTQATSHASCSIQGWRFCSPILRTEQCAFGICNAVFKSIKHARIQIAIGSWTAILP